MRYFILAGEPSGDLHAGNLAREILALDPQAEIHGWGGNNMESAGVKVSTGSDQLSFMGFWEVLLNIFSIFRLFKKVKKEIQEFAPDVVILVDYPGFNLRLSHWLKKKGIKAAWYISPQLWAWKPKRAEIIRKNIGLMLVILPFEKEWYAERGIEVHYVGHPLLDIIPPSPHGPWIMDPERKYIALLPGSRKQEVKRILPVMEKVAAKLPGGTFVIAGRSELDKELYKSNLPNITVVFDKTHEVLQNAKAAVVTSGTATLEAALFMTPQVVVYKGSRISYWIARKLVDVTFISLVNLIRGKRVVTELIQHNCEAGKIYNTLLPLLTNSDTRKAMMEECVELRKDLGTPGASKNAAQLVVSFAQE